MENNIFTDKKFWLHAGRLYGRREPITADFFLTTVCNNKCRYCNYARLDGLPASGKFADKQCLFQWFNRARELGVLGIILTGGGEPTLHPDFEEITSWLESCGIPYGVNSNWSYKSFRIRPRYLKVSLDSWDAAAYLAKRGVDLYDRVIENLKTFCAEKTSTTRVGVQLLLEDAHEAEKFVEKASALPVDYISIRPPESTGGRAVRWEDVLRTVNRLEALKADCNRVIISPKFYQLLENPRPHVRGCPAAWMQLAINPDGGVMYCCQRPYDICGHIMDPDILHKKANFSCNYDRCDYPCRLSRYNDIMASHFSDGVADAEFI